MKQVKIALVVFTFLVSVGALAPPTAEAAPEYCSCSYCEENPTAWCSFIGYTNRCGLFLDLWCGIDGEPLVVGSTGVGAAEANLAADVCRPELTDAEDLNADSSESQRTTSEPVVASTTGIDA